MWSTYESPGHTSIYSRRGQKTSPGGQSSSQGKQGKSICVMVSVDYQNVGHPIFIEGVACYPIVMEEKTERRRLLSALIDAIAELFGLQIVPLLEDSGYWYEEGEVTRGIVTWHHGKGDVREEEIEITP